MLKSILMKLCAGNETLSWLDVLRLSLPAVLSAILSAILSGYLVSRWKSRRDAIERRVDELCDEINKLGDEASGLWSRKAIRSDSHLIARIKSNLNRISRLRVMLEEYVSRSAKSEMVDSEQVFFREISGGDFESQKRPANLLKSYSVLQTTINYVMAVRAAHLKDQKGLWRRR